MRWRQVTENEIAVVLDAPRRVEAADFGKVRAYAQVSGRLLKVTYVEEGECIVVISVVVKKG
jgi:hypothetical protein